MKFSKTAPIFLCMSMMISLGIHSVLGQKILWQAAIGGGGYDNALTMMKADHGCYYLGGVTSSSDGIGKGNHGVGTQDLLVAKVSPEGQIVWKTVIGGAENEEFGQLVQAPNGDLLLVGTTESTDGDAVGNHGKMDILLARIDKYGKLLWSQCFGGTGNDKGFSVLPLDDGGYLLGGESGSKNGDMTYHHGGLDAYIARLDANRKILNNKSLGGKGNETVIRIADIKKDRFLVVCTSNSVDGDVKEFLGEKDVWILCLSKHFDIVWQQAFGGSLIDEAHDVIKVKDGDFVIAGTTFSSDRDLDMSVNSGLGDSWMFRISDQGNLKWSKCYGGSKSEGGNGLSQAADGGFVMVGTTNSKDKIVPGTKGLYDGWIVRTDSMGKKTWTATFGGEDFEYLYGVEALKDGNYLAVGFAESQKGDLLPTGKQTGNDLWMLRFGDPQDSKDNVLRSSPYLTGIASDSETGSPIDAQVTITNNENLAKVKEGKSSTNGRYEVDLPKTGKYSVMFTAKGYMFHGEDIDYAQLSQSPEIRIDAKLVPLKVGSKVILKLIYFDPGKWELKPESDPELRRLEKFLKDHPNLKVEISGHTDNTGSPETKLQLSENRANRVRDWLLKNGVPGRQMTVKGYGQDRPIDTNDTEEGRTRNRRVECTIVELLD